MTHPDTLSIVVVHYHSNGSIAALLDDLSRQDHKKLEIVIVECGDDGSVGTALKACPLPVRVVGDGTNLGYCAGNNLAFGCRAGADVAIINPDVRLPDPHALSHLHARLRSDDALGAVGPAIHTPDGRLEHADSLIDFDDGRAIHVRTWLDKWPEDLGKQRHDVPWLDGSCLLIRGEALHQVGGFDERYFLYCEEVDWSIRATQQRWKLAILPETQAVHSRSASFAGSQKGSYYYWRNNYLLFSMHAPTRNWVRRWVRDVVRYVLAWSNIRSGASLMAVRGATDALRARYGPMRGRGGP